MRLLRHSGFNIRYSLLLLLFVFFVSFVVQVVSPRYTFSADDLDRFATSAAVTSRPSFCDR